MQQPKRLRAIIVDDEPNARTNLELLLARYCPAVNVLESCEDVDHAAFSINKHRPDVVFLDVAMPRKNGFDLLNMLSFTPMIVFVTAYERFALRAIKASAVDFLLKPVDIDELKQVEKRLVEMSAIFSEDHANVNYAPVLKSLMSTLRNRGQLRTLTIPTNSGFDIVAVDEVIYLQGENNYTTFQLRSNRKVVVSRTLKDYEEVLEDSDFFRIHKSFLINLRHLRSVISNNGLEAGMTDGKVLPVSRRRSSEFLAKAKSYVDVG